MSTKNTPGQPQKVNTIISFPKDGEDRILANQFERMIYSCIRYGYPLERAFLSYTNFLSEFGEIKTAAEAETSLQTIKADGLRDQTTASLNRYLLLGHGAGWTYGNIYLTFPHEKATKLSDAEMTEFNVSSPWVIGVLDKVGTKPTPPKGANVSYKMKKSDPVVISMDNLPLELRRWYVDTEGNLQVVETARGGSSFADVCRAKGYHPAKTAAEIVNGAKSIEDAAKKANQKIVAELIEKHTAGKLTKDQLIKMVAQYPSLTETEIIDVVGTALHLGEVYATLNAKSRARKAVWVWTKAGLVGNFPSKAIAEDRLSLSDGPFYFTTTDKPPKEIQELVVAKQNRLNLTTAILGNFKDELTEQQRKALTLVISSDKTESQISAEMGLTPEKYKNVLDTASASLLKSLSTLVKNAGKTTSEPLTIRIDDSTAPAFAVDIAISNAIQKIKRQSIFTDVKE